jgi:hypothetical protein
MDRDVISCSTGNLPVPNFKKGSTGRLPVRQEKHEQTHISQSIYGSDYSDGVADAGE